MADKKSEIHTCGSFLTYCEELDDPTQTLNVDFIGLKETISVACWYI
jgi:hypothetical protein